VKSIRTLNVKIFADGANKQIMLEMKQNPFIKGFTTNPTLMRKTGIENYEYFAKDMIKHLPEHPISFEIFADNLNEMYEQALIISSWGDNVYTKIPITNTQGQSTTPLIKKLAQQGVKQNITAIMTLQQVEESVIALKDGPSSYISVFAGRIADTGRDPYPVMQNALAMMRPYPQLELIWASPRELLNIFQAAEMGCHIITVTDDIIKKLSLIGKDLNEYSLETVQMFYEDAQRAGFVLHKAQLEAEKIDQV
jgi:transaldolase